MSTLSDMIDRSRIRSLLRLVRFHWLLSVHRARDPHAAGLSFGFGVFLGFLPMGALATVAALLLTRKAGLPSPPAIAGTFAGNWITTPFIYAASLWTGSVLTTGKMPTIPHVPAEGAHWYDSFLAVLSYGPSFLVGILLVSLAAGVVGYFVIRSAVKQVRAIRHRLYARRIESMG